LRSRSVDERIIQAIAFIMNRNLLRELPDGRSYSGAQVMFAA
jgi:hypothetical protein